ncbi:MAG: 1,4-alpha-glucan branching protein GlgB [Verrucomicrobia bacterium]|nr:1,4-alpha-glucan branching protein GlgB [Cytophagales bacterium]
MAKKPKSDLIPVATLDSSPINSSQPENQVSDFVYQNTITGVSLFSEFDIHLFREGKHFSLYEKLGNHPMTYQGVQGTYFAVWCPNAEYVSIVADSNGWNKASHPMFARWDGSGIWEAFVPYWGKGTTYKYFIASRYNGYTVEKADPFAFHHETPPATASKIWDLDYQWDDQEFMENRQKNTGKTQPMTVYEMHLGSWRRKWEQDGRSLTYRELAEELPGYVQALGFTHIEFMPVMEHPFFGSWGYQVTGYFAPSSRFGTPEEFMFLIDKLHQYGIGVILDWVPSHFPGDLHGLYFFDGTHLYEHADMRKGFHPDWKSYIFNYDRNEIKSFLISNALFWLDKCHIDGLRVDAVASMLYLDYSRKEGEWEPNHLGGRENLEAVALLKLFNETVYKNFPDVHTIAEESTSFPGVSRPTYTGGLGFGQKWMMGWMHDTLKYLATEPINRKYHQGQLTFSLAYAFSENFMLPLSHDEVVHGKNPLIYKLPGDDWQRFATLRLLYGYMYGHPGTKLLFMGAELGQTTEWNHDGSLAWHLMDYAPHQGVWRFVQQLNTLYKHEKALYELPFDSYTFEWIDTSDTNNSVISFVRKGKNPEDTLVIVCNFTPVVRGNYRIGVPKKGAWREILNSDWKDFWGSGIANGTVYSEDIYVHHRHQSISLTLPPLGVIFLKCER